MLGLSDQAGMRVKSRTAGESIDRWLEGFGDERGLHQGDQFFHVGVWRELAREVILI